VRKLSLTVGPEWAGMRVQAALEGEFCMSRGFISRLKRRPLGITVNGEKAYTTRILACGDVLQAEIGDEEGYPRARPMAYPLKTVWEDEDILIIDKPAGLAVHSSTRNPEELTLENAVSACLPAGDNYHPVSRLDRGTTGLMTIARNGYTHHRLKALLHTPEFLREYLAIAVGRVEPEHGHIRLPIGFAAGSTYQRAVAEDGAPSHTEYFVLGCYGGLTLLRLIPHTGRTHQLRLHMAAIGHPLTGDWLYGREGGGIGRPALHSAMLRLRVPLTGEALSLVSPLPHDMAALLPQGAAGELCGYFNAPYGGAALC